MVAAIVAPLPQLYSGLPMSCTQTGVSEPTKDVLGGHAPQRLAQGIVEFGLRPRLGPAEPLLDPRGHRLDRDVVRAVRRQWQHPRPRVLDRLRHPRGQVGLEVVPHHHVPPRAAPAPAPDRRRTGTPPCRWTLGTPAGRAPHPAPTPRSPSPSPTRPGPSRWPADRMAPRP